ncbi:hypothetical protein ACOSQ3_023673 [Xanthoceras sorbifolium]
MEVEGSLRRSIFMEATGSREASSTCGGNGDGSRSRDQAMTDVHPREILLMCLARKECSAKKKCSPKKECSARSSRPE